MTAPRDSIRILLDAPILFEAGGQTVHAPMVDVRVRDTITKLILDTGSTDHVLTIALARAARLDADPGAPGTDHAGDPVPSWSIGEVPIRIGDLDLELRDVVAIEGPAPFAGWGVGGFLSPQHLHPTAFVVMDLADDRLIVVDGDESAVASWLESRSPSLARLSLERLTDHPEIVVLGAVDPFADGPTMLNTGGRGTEFLSAALPGLRGTGSHVTGHGVGGGEVLGAVADGQTLRIGGARPPVASLIVREAMGSADGLVGMDVLRGTVLMVSADRGRPVSWLVPRAFVTT